MPTEPPDPLASRRYTAGGQVPGQWTSFTAMYCRRCECVELHLHRSICLYGVNLYYTFRCRVVFLRVFQNWYLFCVTETVTRIPGVLFSTYRCRSFTQITKYCLLKYRKNVGLQRDSCGSCISILTINSHYFPVHHSLNGLSSGSTLCPL